MEMDILPWIIQLHLKQFAWYIDGLINSKVFVAYF